MTMTVWWVVLGMLFLGMAGIYMFIFFASPFVVIAKWFSEKRAKIRERSRVKGRA